MKIKVTAFDDDLNAQIKKWLEDEILAFIEQHNLTSTILDTVSIPANFGDDVKAYQRKLEMREGYTDNQEISAFGKLLHYQEKDNIKSVLIISADIMSCLTRSDANWIAYFSFYHEMYHILDTHLLGKHLSIDFILKELNDAETFGELLSLYGNTIWSEYFASLSSSMRCSSSFKEIEEFPDTVQTILLIPTLLDLVDKTMTLAKKEVEDYREHGVIDLLNVKIQEATINLLLVAARVVGHLEGYQSDELSKSVVEKLSNTYFLPIWETLAKEVESLMDRWPNWEDVSELDSLGEVILKCWNAFGMFPRASKSSLIKDRYYIDVPSFEAQKHTQHLWVRKTKTLPLCCYRHQNQILPPCPSA